MNVSRCIKPFLSIFTAELLAIRDGLLYCLSQENGNITITSDSRSCIQSITKNSHSNPIVQEIQQMIIETRKNVTLCWVPSHIGVPLNKRADVSTCGATEGDVADSAVPRSDMKIQITSKVKDSWLDEWQNTTNNKFRTVKAIIELY